MTINSKTKIILVFLLFPLYIFAQNKIREKSTPFFTGGNLCPNYLFVDMNGENVNINSLRGNYIYIDVWASWCGACTQEFPALKELEKEFAEKNIYFLSLSLDDSIDKCKLGMDKNNLTSIVWLAGPDHQIVKDFDIRSIPRFILIDPEGIVVHNRFSAPSAPTTIEILRRLKNL